ncbi:hypothetical protein GE21DRAFT_1100061 [Neurospora crassa]|nr:hypothetical protein GE21DRAFT_1100061 [Neurospora crassa]
MNSICTLPSRPVITQQENGDLITYLPRDSASGNPTRAFPNGTTCPATPALLQSPSSLSIIVHKCLRDRYPSWYWPSLISLISHRRRQKKKKKKGRSLDGARQSPEARGRGFYVGIRGPRGRCSGVFFSYSKLLPRSQDLLSPVSSWLSWKES